MGLSPASLRAPLTTGGAHRAEEGILLSRRVGQPVLALASPPQVRVVVRETGETVVAFPVARVGGKRGKACSVRARVLAAADAGSLQPVDFVGGQLPEATVSLPPNIDLGLFVVRLAPREPPDEAQSATVLIDLPVRCALATGRVSAVLVVDAGDAPVPAGPWAVEWSDPGDAAGWLVWGGAGAPA